MRTFPLCWPDGWPRTNADARRSSRFRTGTDRSRHELLHELKLFGASHVVVSTDVPTRNDGQLYASATMSPRDPGIVVYFQWCGKPYHVACDAYDSLSENVRALFLTIKAWRTIERHGASQLLERVVSGFSALPPSAEADEPPSEPWWEVLGVPQVGDSLPVEIANDLDHPLRRPILALCESLYRAKIRDAHPDRGGSHEAMLQINRAIEEARAALGKE